MKLTSEAILRMDLAFPEHLRKCRQCREGVAHVDQIMEAAALLGINLPPTLLLTELCGTGRPLAEADIKATHPSAQPDA